MKYTFDIDERNNKLEIKLEVAKTSGYSSVAAKTITSSKYNPNWDSSFENLLTDIIDNMRLTVQERNEVYENSNILIQYFKQCFSNEQSHQENNPSIIIAENDDPVNILDESLKNE